MPTYFVLSPALRTATPATGALPLEVMQKWVDGYVEAIRLPQPGLWLYVNEDGRSKDLLPNPLAMRLAGQLILGTALVVRVGPEGDTVDLTGRDEAIVRSL